MNTLPKPISPEAREALCVAYEKANTARVECFSYFHSLHEACEARHTDHNASMRAWSAEVEALNNGSDPKYDALHLAEDKSREDAGQVFSAVAEQFPWLGKVAHYISWLGVDNPQEKLNEVIDREYREAIVDVLRERYGPETKPMRAEVLALPLVYEPSALAVGDIVFSTVENERVLTVTRKTHNGKRVFDASGERLLPGRAGGYMDAKTGYRKVAPEWAERYAALCQRWKTDLAEAQQLTPQMKAA